MAWEIILPIAANIIQGAIGHGIAANQAARENNRQAHLAGLRRQELQPIIDKLRDARNFFGVEEQLVRDFSRASDQMAAQSAQTGMTNAGSGGLDQQRADLLGGMLAELAQFKAQDEMQRTQMLAQILSDPMHYGGEGERDNVGAQTFWGALGGGTAGAGTVLNSFLSTEEGLAALGSIFGANQPVQPERYTPTATTPTAAPYVPPPIAPPYTPPPQPMGVRSPNMAIYNVGGNSGAFGRQGK